MGPSEKSFNQVKAIQSKLDRSIDQLRERRNTPDTPSGLGPPIHQGTPTPSRTAMPAPITPAPGANANPARPASQYGRATPLPPPMP